MKNQDIFIIQLLFAVIQAIRVSFEFFPEEYQYHGYDQ